MIPSMGSLFETIDNLLKFTHKRWAISINKAWWLVHVDIIMKRTLKKCIVDIKVPKRPAI